MPTNRQPKTPISINEFKQHELYGVVTFAANEQGALSDDAIVQKLAAAEDFYERSLQIRFQETRVFSDVWGRQHSTFPPGSIADLPDDFDPINDLDEPAYDYATDFWGGDQWGKLFLNYRPIRDISQVFFAFPGTQPVWSVPLTWLRPDRKFGSFQIVPSSSVAVYATFNAYILGVLAGGRGLPQSIYVDYTVGFTPDELCTHHNDLLEGVRLHAMLATLGLVSTAANPGGVQSSSLSIDGLSRSRSWGGKWGAYSGKIELAIQREQDIRESWARKEKGIPLAFVEG